MPYYPTKTYSTYVYFRDKDDALIDPDTTTVTIYDPEGTSQGTEDLDLVSVGKYELNYNIPADAIRGDWSYVVEATLSSGPYKGIERFYFEVELMS